MKRLKTILIWFMILALFAPMSVFAQGPTAREEMRGLWVASVLNIDYPSKSTSDPNTLKEEAVSILNQAENIGINAIFLQVRPTADAFYPSKYFPWSKYLTGKQGVAPDNYFDPLNFWIQEGHKRGIEIHAWLNPYRITKKTKAEKDHDWDSLSADNPAKKYPNLVVQHTDGNLYFNPGEPDARKLIIDGAMEIVENYDIDGIHFDDYFYPGKDFADEKTYETYGAGFASKEDWRRESVNTLLRDLQNSIKSVKQNVRFGISPFGIWKNKSSDDLGSDTRGLESYSAHYADSRAWVKDGYIDYITPQIYWNIGYEIADYKKLLNWWADVVRGTNVDLYIGQAAYRTGNSKQSSPWYGASEIERQLNLNEQKPEVKGSIFYNTSAMMEKPELAALVQSYYLGETSGKFAGELKVGRPTKDLTTSYDTYYLNGVSDPKLPLYLNGELVTNRSKQGYFGILVNLNVGQNQFVFTQSGKSAVRNITKRGPWSPTEMSRIGISSKNVYPASPVYKSTGDTITLSCTAPIGANVSVSINGQTFNMNPRTTHQTPGKTYATTYSYNYVLPSISGNSRMVNLGKPVYRMNYNGMNDSKTASSEIGVIMEKAPVYAEVIVDAADTYKQPPSSNGSLYQIYKGMYDRVTKIDGDYVKLSSGLWTKRKFVKIVEDSVLRANNVLGVSYVKSSGEDIISFNLLKPAMGLAGFDGEKITLSLVETQSDKAPTLPVGAMVTSMAGEQNGDVFKYSFNLNPNERLGGYYVEKNNTGLNLHIKRLPKASHSITPLAGITIMLDPGHGGKDSGAIGPMGLEYSEKHFNLEAAKRLKTKLENYGANVLMTRTDDTYLSLPQRLELSRAKKPDLFVSIHADSMADNVDISKIHGFSIYYHEVFAKEPATEILSRAVGELNRKDRGMHDKLFYVVRGTWAPSILFESGFIPNPDEFEWLTDNSAQEEFSGKIAEAIVGYFLK